MKILKNKFFLLSTLVIILLCSCQNNAENKSSNTNQTTAMKDSTVITVSDTLKSFLVNSTVQDFHKNKQNSSVEFRNVFLKLYETETYLICGEFLEKKQPEKWVDFATLKTEGYELWIGGNATTYCNDAKTISSSTEDLATILNTQLKSLQGVSDK
jgi:hypothetical protein